MAISRLSVVVSGFGGGFDPVHTTLVVISERFGMFQDVSGTAANNHVDCCVVVLQNWTVGGKIPVVAGTDAEVYLACARTAGIRELAQCRACRVVNTLKV